MKVKRWLAFALSAAMVFTCGGSAFASEQMEDADTEMLSVCATGTEIVDSGTCGDDLTWTLDDEGTLTISGSGDMDDYGSSWEDSAPWGESVISVIIENGVTSIGEYSFYENESLTNISIPESVENIGICAFCRCESLSDINGGNGVIYVGKSAFSDTPWLKGQEKTKVGVIWGCYLGETFISTMDKNYSEEIKAGWFELNGTECFLFYVDLPDDTVMIVSTAGSWETVGNWEEILNSPIHDMVDKTISAIGSESFCASYGISLSAPDVWYLPEGIEYIGETAFHLQDLTKVVMPSTLKEIGDYAFYKYAGWINYQDAALSSVTLSDGLEKIGAYAFCDCNMNEIEIPSSVTEIGEYAFGYKYKGYDDDGYVVMEKVDGFIIYGCSGTAAETYADENGFTFMSTDGSGTDTLLIRRGNMFYVNYTLKGGDADMSFTYGKDTDEVLIGDWDGDGIDTICVRRGNRFYFSNTLGGQADFYIDFGRTSDEVVVGDWDGDGCDTICVRRGNHYYINNTLESGNAAVDFTFGRVDDEVLAGDWDGDGYDTLCIRRGNTYYINNTLEGGNAAIDFTFGRTSDSVLSGDWDGDGYDTLCIRRGNHYYINNTLEGGNAAIDFTFGRDGDEVYAGTWK